MTELVGGGWSEHLDGRGGERKTRMAEVSWESAGEKDCGSALVGSRVRIWWDGDRTFYEGNVVG